MNTCDSCKWWIRDETEQFERGWEYIANYGVCDALMNPGPTPTPTASFLQGGYDDADLRTGPKFGCVKWEAKG